MLARGRVRTFCARVASRNIVASYCTAKPPPLTNNSPALNFREFVNQLRADGDLVEINDPVDPNQELAAISRKAIEQRDKAQLFNNIIGAQNGLFRALGAPASCRQDPAKRYSRLARHLGLPETASEKDIQLKLYSTTILDPIPPKMVHNAVCQENVIMGNDVDLSEMPQLQIHPEDGGKYVQTYGVHCMHAPPQEARWINWSISRGMPVPALGKNAMVCSIYPGQHIDKLIKLWAKYGNEVPWALSFGAPPLAAAIGSSPIPELASECDYVGALAGTPVEVVKCKTNSCYVPANSEIVFEGKIIIDKMADEGPYGEMYGMLWRGEQKHWNMFVVDAITYRNDAIMPVSATGKQADETHTLMGFSTAAIALSKLKQGNLPVLNVHVPPEAYTSWLVVQFDTKALASRGFNSEMLRKQVGDLLYPNGDIIIITNTILVDERTNPYDFSDVIWTLSTRSRPNMQQTFFEDVIAYPLMPFMSHGPEFGARRGGKVVTDCIFPYQYKTPLQYDYAVADYQSYSEELKSKVNANWKKWGFETDPRGYSRPCN